MGPRLNPERPGIRRRVAALLLAAILGGCETAPAGDAGAAALPSPAELAAQLPPDAAGFRRGQTLPLGDRVGREVAYATPGRTAAGATVEVFRPDDQAMPDGAASTAATAAFELLISNALRQQPPRQVRERRRFPLPADGPPLLHCVETEGSYGREQVEGLLCAGAAGGSLLRVRVAMPLRDPPVGDATAFAAAILNAVRSHATRR